MPLRLNQTTATAVQLGDNAVVEIWHGDRLAWPTDGGNRLRTTQRPVFFDTRGTGRLYSTSLQHATDPRGRGTLYSTQKIWIGVGDLYSTQPPIFDTRGVGDLYSTQPPIFDSRGVGDLYSTPPAT